MTVANAAEVTTEAEWRATGASGSWDTDASWSGGTKPDYSKIATFRNEGAAPVAGVSGRYTVGALRFDRTSEMTVNSNGALTLADSKEPFVDVIKGENVVTVPLAVPKETAYAVADGAQLSISGKISNGSVTKTGGGKLVLDNDDNSFIGKIKLQEGTLKLVDEEAFEYNAASPENGLLQTGGTFEFNSNAEATYAGTVTFNPGANETVIINNETNLTFSSVTITDSDFVKRGAGRLALSAATAQTVAKDRGNQGGAEVTFPADGSAPPYGGYAGFNVTEGELVLSGADFSSNYETIVGLNTLAGAADPVLTMDGITF